MITESKTGCTPIEPCKHYTTQDLITFMVDVIITIKKVPKGDHWGSLTYVNDMGYPSTSAYSRRFGSFDKAIERAIKEIKEKYPKAYFQDRRN
jgi:hypothetical protein